MEQENKNYNIVRCSQKRRSDKPKREKGDIGKLGFLRESEKENYVGFEECDVILVEGSRVLLVLEIVFVFNRH